MQTDYSQNFNLKLQLRLFPIRNLNGQEIAQLVPVEAESKKDTHPNEYNESVNDESNEWRVDIYTYYVDGKKWIVQVRTRGSKFGRFLTAG